MDESKWRRAVVKILIISIIGMAVVCCTSNIALYLQSRSASEEVTEIIRIYFETDYDYIEYPSIDMSQSIGDEK